MIQLLLEAAGADDVSRELVSVDPRGLEAPADWDDLRSPETYIGYARATNLCLARGASHDAPAIQAAGRFRASTTGRSPAIGRWSARQPC